MKIYKYYSWNVPKCVNLWRGYYANKNNQEVIGFGDDSTSPDNNAAELTETEFYSYVTNLGESITEAEELLLKLSSLSLKKLEGNIVKNVKEVAEIVKSKIDSLFSDPEGKLSSEQYKERLMAQIIYILLADSGRITYLQTNIANVTDKKTSDDFIASLLPKWLEAKQIRDSAEQFIIDNDLE